MATVPPSFYVLYISLRLGPRITVGFALYVLYPLFTLQTVLHVHSWLVVNELNEVAKTYNMYFPVV